MKTLAISTIERARAYVVAIPGAVSGAGGHNRTFAVARKLVEFGLTPSETWPLLVEYNQRCEPPWSEAQLRHKLEDAFRCAHAHPGFVGSRLPFRIARPYKVKIDPATATENFLKGFRCDDVDLWETSPVRPPDDWTKDALALLESLYRPGEQINFVTAFETDIEKDGRQKARPVGIGETVERDSLIARWRKHGMPRNEAGGWLRMNPLDGQGVTDADA